nr:type II toxin-antitoxin system VapC family toxin [Sphingomonas formosensis]
MLLDTNVMSELMKPTPDAVVEHWFLRHEEECVLASIAIGELAYGVAKLEAGARKQRLGEQIAEWRLHFAGRTHAFTAATAMLYGEILGKARRAGRPMSVPDAQIAAIAQQHDCTLATRNVPDFQTTGLALINPWE